MHIHYKVGDEITYPFPNFNGTILEDSEWIDNFAIFVKSLLVGVAASKS